MKRNEEIDFQEKDIHWAVGEYALLFDGYCAADVASYDDATRKRFFDDFKQYFYIPKDKLLSRTMLFMLQRYFGKWGGEQTPEYDRDFSLYYLLYLEVYRYKFNSVFTSDFDPFHEYLPKVVINETILENLAGAIRRHFSGGKRPTLNSIDYILDNCFSDTTRGFPEDKKLLSRPEVILAASIKPILATNLLLRHSSETFSMIMSELSCKRRDDAVYSFGKELRSMLRDLKLSQNDIKNHLFLFILQAWLSRHTSCIDTLSAEYILLMFLYLHLYRTEIPEYMGREPFFSQWTNLAKSHKEDTAELFRKKLCLLREDRLKKLAQNRGHDRAE